MPWPEKHAGTNYNYVWDGISAWVPETQPSGGGGGGATIGNAVPATATAIAVKDNVGNLKYPLLDASGNLLVAVTGAGSGGTSSVDGVGYTAGTTAGTPALGAVDDTGTTACAEDKVGIVRITPQRAFHSNLRNQAGTEVGTSANPLSVKTEQQLDYDTGAGVATQSLVGIALPASGGPVAGGTATNPIQVSLANTGANGTPVKVDGSAVTQPVSAASLPLPAGAATQATLASVLAALPAALGAHGGLLVEGIANGVAIPVSFAGSGVITLQTSQVSGVANATTTRTVTTGLDVYSDLDILINITGAGAATGVLQLYLQDSADGGTTWDDLVSSNTFVFGASVITQRFKISGRIATSATQGGAAQTEALAAGNVRYGPFGDRIRVREKVSGVAGTPTGATYTITMVAKR